MDIIKTEAEREFETLLGGDAVRRDENGDRPVGPVDEWEEPADPREPTDEEVSAFAEAWMEEVNGGNYRFDARWMSEYANNDSCGDKGIIAANWNYVSRETQRLLEQAGYTLDWCDTVTECSGCCKAIQTQPDSYSWKPEFHVGDGEILCECCIGEDPESILADLRGNPDKALTLDSIDLAEHGYVKAWGEFESGFHHGQDDSPRAIAKALEKRGVEDYIFSLDGKGQFDVSFSVWVKDDGTLPYVVSKPGSYGYGHDLARDEDGAVRVFDTAEEALQHGDDVWAWPNLDPREGKAKVSPATAMEAALRSVPSHTGEGIQYTKVTVGDEGATVTTRTVTPEEFIAGIKD